MEKRPAVWFRNLAIVSIIVSAIMVDAMDQLQRAHLSLWIHIPLTLVVLTLIGGGALVAGVSFCEFRARMH